MAQHQQSYTVLLQTVSTITSTNQDHTSDQTLYPDGRWVGGYCAYGKLVTPGFNKA